jgi:uncharacterized lipoprotein YehR (DUF1307 family)
MREAGKLHWLAILVAASVCLSLTGCGESKITKANFDRILVNDMTEDEVVRILGNGEEQGEVDPSRLGVNMPNLGGGVGRFKKITWQDGSKKITVTFRNDKVANKVSSGL